jgi:hypothetical protein
VLRRAETVEPAIDPEASDFDIVPRITFGSPNSFRVTAKCKLSLLAWRTMKNARRIRDNVVHKEVNPDETLDQTTTCGQSAKKLVSMITSLYLGDRMN